MIVAREFTRSAAGRDADFSTHVSERGTFIFHDVLQSHSDMAEDVNGTEPRALGPRRRRRVIRGCLVAQFAAANAAHLADACEMIAPWVDAVDG